MYLAGACRLDQLRGRFLHWQCSIHPELRFSSLRVRLQPVNAAWPRPNRSSPVRVPHAHVYCTQGSPPAPVGLEWYEKSSMRDIHAQPHNCGVRGERNVADWREEVLGGVITHAGRRLRLLFKLIRSVLIKHKNPNWRAPVAENSCPAASFPP